MAGVTYAPINLTEAVVCSDAGRGPLAGIYFAVGAGLVGLVLLAMLLLWLYDRFVVQEEAKRQGEYERLYGKDEADEKKDSLLQKIYEKESMTRLQSWLNQAATPENTLGIVVLSIDLFGRPANETYKIVTLSGAHFQPITMKTCATSDNNLLGIGWACAAVSLGVYLVAVSSYLPSLELCDTMPNAGQILDFLVNLYMLLFFSIRVYAADNKFQVLLGPYAMLDYFVLPNALITLFLNRYFTGYQFLRSYNLLWIVPVIGFSGTLRSPSHIRLTYLACLVLATLFVATGFLHLAENKGDPYWMDSGSHEGHIVSFWRCFLYLYGKLTLIDISGIRVLTNLGNLVVIIWQLAALGIIVAALSEIFSRIKPTPDYDKEYECPSHHLHVILTGHITVESMREVLGDFYHEDKELAQYFKVVILHDEKPDDGMSQLMKSYYTRVAYRRGSIMEPKDAGRVKMQEAAATIILVDRTSSDPNYADSLNVMRVIAVKDLKPDARVIVQLIQYQSKAFLRNIPTWHIEDGDLALCIAELRLGLLAQSCSAPGFSTMLGNLFFCKSEAECRAITKKSQEIWMEPYAYGMRLEMYARRLSHDFEGWTFLQVFEFCYVRLKILLIAVKLDSADLATAPQVNPPPDLVIKRGTTGYYITNTAKEAERALHFCAHCHRDVMDPELIKKCECRQGQSIQPLNALMAAQMARKDRKKIMEVEQRPLPDGKNTWEAKMWMHIRNHWTQEDLKKNKKTESDQPGEGDDGQKTDEEIDEDENEDDGQEQGDFPTPKYDSTGMFHWCPSRTIDEATKTRRELSRMDLKGHIVVCLMSEPRAPPVGLHSFCLPLRASAIKEEHLRPIVIITKHDFHHQEWRNLMNLPKITILKGTAVERADLRASHLSTCRQCVILSSPMTRALAKKSDAGRVVDKTVILATLNIRSMKFTTLSAPKPVRTPDNQSDDENDTDSLAQEKRYMRPHFPRQTGYEVPIITDLHHATNVAYVDQTDTDDGRSFEISTPYATGRAFSADALNLLVIEAFFNPVIVNVFRVLIFSGASAELEKVLAEGAGLIGGKHISQRPHLEDQVLIKQFAIQEGPMAKHAQSTYGGMVVDALKTQGRLCLGVYRKINLTDDSPVAAARFVISNPDEDFILDPSDLIFSVVRADKSNVRLGSPDDGGDAQENMEEVYADNTYEGTAELHRE